jgi:flagellar assembly protein FliH
MSARLIKPGNGTDPQSFPMFALPEDGTRNPPASFFEADAQPGVSIEKARSEAERIVADARARAAEIESQAVENGRRLMQAEITSEAARIAEPWQEEVRNTLNELANLGAAITSQAERDLVRLAIEIAKKIVHREVTVDHEIVLTLARIGLARLQSRIAAKIHLNPNDVAYVNSHRDRLDPGHVIEIVEDRSIGRGGCLVHTEMGDVDARIEQQFAEIERSFLGD